MNLRFNANKNNSPLPSNRNMTITRVRYNNGNVNTIPRLNRFNIRLITRLHIQYMKRKMKIGNSSVLYLGRTRKRIINTQRQRTIQRFTIRQLLQRRTITRVTKIMRRIINSRMHNLTITRISTRPFNRDLRLTRIPTITNRTIRPSGFYNTLRQRIISRGVKRNRRHRQQTTRQCNGRRHRHPMTRLRNLTTLSTLHRHHDTYRGRRRMNKRRRRRLIKANILRPHRRRRTSHRLANARHKRNRPLTTRNVYSTRPSRSRIRRTSTRSIMMGLNNRTTSIMMEVTIKMIGNRSLTSRKPRRNSRHGRNARTRNSRITRPTSNRHLINPNRLYTTSRGRRYMKGMMTSRRMRVPPTNRGSHYHNRGRRNRPTQLRLFGTMIRHRRRGNRNRSRTRPIQLNRRHTRPRGQRNRRPQGTSRGMVRPILRPRRLPRLSSRTHRRRRRTK